MRSTSELSERGTRPSLVTVSSHIGRACGRLGVIEPYSNLRAREISPPVAQRMTRKWALAYRPVELISNLRPGLPCWLAWYAVQRGWPLTVIVAQEQLAKAPADVQNLLVELWFMADRTHVVSDVFARDQLIRDLVPVIGIDEILQMTVPIMAHADDDVVRSDDEGEADYGHGSGDSQDLAQPQGA